MPTNPEAKTRLRPVIIAYLEELAKLGPYGKARAGVMRHFIENGVVAALQAGVLDKKDVRDFGETLGEEDE